MKMNWIKMTTTIPATCLALVFLACGVHDVPAGEALPGSPDFSPSARQPVGWRGDGTGKYPGANPPIHWNRTSKQAAAMKCSSAVPTNQSPANAMSAGAGFFTEWLVAAPISCANVTNAIAQELTPGEAAMSPQEGDKIGDTTWKRVPVDNSYVDVWKDHKPMTTQQAALVAKILKNRQQYYSTPAISIHYLHKASRSDLKKIKALVGKYRVLLTMHAAENEEWVQACVEKFGQRTIGALVDLGRGDDMALAVAGEEGAGNAIEVTKRDRP